VRMLFNRSGRGAVLINHRKCLDSVLEYTIGFVLKYFLFKNILKYYF
jgi:hypothetical protein